MTYITHYMVQNFKDYDAMEQKCKTLQLHQQLRFRRHFWPEWAESGQMHPGPGADLAWSEQFKLNTQKFSKTNCTRTLIGYGI